MAHKKCGCRKGQQMAALGDKEENPNGLRGNSFLQILGKGLSEACTHKINLFFAFYMHLCV
jgi:hypothetical protein